MWLDVQTGTNVAIEEKKDGHHLDPILPFKAFIPMT